MRNSEALWLEKLSNLEIGDILIMVPVHHRAQTHTRGKLKRSDQLNHVSFTYDCHFQSKEVQYAILNNKNCPVAEGLVVWHPHNKICLLGGQIMKYRTTCILYWFKKGHCVLVLSTRQMAALICGRIPEPLGVTHTHMGITKSKSPTGTTRVEPHSWRPSCFQ